MLAKAKYLPRYALLYGPLLLAATGPWNPLLNVVNMPEGLDVSSPSTSWLVPTPNKTGGFFSVKGAMNHKYVPYMLIQGEQCTTYATYPLAVAPKPAAAVIEVAWRDENVDKMLKTDDVAEVNDALETGDDSAIPSLRELAAAQDLFIGTCVDSGQPLGNASYLDGNYTRFSAEQFSIVTAEGSMKWAYTQPADDGKFVFTGGDQIIAAAHTHKWKVRGHNLAWDIANPKWLYQNFTGKKLRQLLKTHIDTVVGRWKGEIYSWDVINEGISSHPAPHLKQDTAACKGALPCQTTVWWPASVVNESYIEMAFRWAHAADPDAKLFWNDGCAEGKEPKSETVFDFVEGMLARGVPVHGVGLETHFKLHDDACGEGFQSPAAIEENMKKLAGMGLEVHVTEMDVQLNLTASGDVSLVQGSLIFESVSAVLQKQAEVYAGVMRACLNVPACKSWGVWGFYGRGHKDLFDERFVPKPAFWAVVRELKKGRPENGSAARPVATVED